MSNEYIKDFKRLTEPVHSWMQEAGTGTMGPDQGAGGYADLTPLRNKAREAVDSLASAQRAADQGRMDDCLEYFRRAKAVIDIALGGQVGPYASTPGVVTPRP